jgi:hypothetical protein
LQVTFFAAGSIHFARQVWPQARLDCTELRPATGPSTRGTSAVRMWLACADPPLTVRCCRLPPCRGILLAATIAPFASATLPAEVTKRNRLTFPPQLAGPPRAPSSHVYRTGRAARAAQPAC